VLPRLSVKLSVDSWFAVMPAGIEIIIAMEKPKAIITNSALILRLEIFLIALVNMPNFVHLSKYSRKRRQPKRENWRRVWVFVENVFVAVILRQCFWLLLPFSFWLFSFSTGKSY